MEQKIRRRSFWKTYDMTKDPPGKALFFFTIPLLAGNLFQQFYNMADSMIVGRYVGEEALAAVGASYSLTMVFIMVAIGAGMGASVITAQYLGAESYTDMKLSVYTALLSLAVLGILLGAAGYVWCEPILHALDTPENIMGDAVVYLRIYFLGLPFLFLYNIQSAMFNALGDSRIPLCLLMCSSVLNIVLDLVMVRNFGFGVAGAAVATLIAQGTAAICSFAVLQKVLKRFGTGERAEAQKEQQLPEKNKTGSRERQAYFSFTILGRMARIAFPSMIQQSIVSVGMLLVQSVVNGFGSAVLAGYSAAVRIESICHVPMLAMGNAMATFTAQNLGARQPERVKTGYRYAVGLTAGFALCIFLVITLSYPTLLAAFLESGSGTAAMETGQECLVFIRFFYILFGLKAVTDGVLRGAGDVLVFTLANLCNLGLRICISHVFAPVWGVQAVWIAIPMGWTVNLILSFLWMKTGKWSRKKIIG